MVKIEIENQKTSWRSPIQTKGVPFTLNFGGEHPTGIRGALARIKDKIVGHVQGVSIIPAITDLPNLDFMHF